MLSPTLTWKFGDLSQTSPTICHPDQLDECSHFNLDQGCLNPLELGSQRRSPEVDGRVFPQIFFPPLPCLSRHPLPTHDWRFRVGLGWGAYTTPNFQDLARFLPVLPHELAWASSYLSLSTTLFLFFPFGAVASELFSDNTTAITCILHQGNLRSDPLMLLSTHILEFYWHHSICQDPKLISGSLNVLPDQSSSPNPISMEWTLDRRTFEWVCSHVSSALRRVLNSKNCWNDLKWPLCDN